MLSVVFSILIICIVAALCIAILEWGLSMLQLSIDGRIIKLLEALIVVIALWRIISLLLTTTTGSPLL